MYVFLFKVSWSDRFLSQILRQTNFDQDNLFVVYTKNGKQSLWFPLGWVESIFSCPVVGSVLAVGNRTQDPCEAGECYYRYATTVVYLEFNMNRLIVFWKFLDASDVVECLQNKLDSKTLRITIPWSMLESFEGTPKSESLLRHY